MKRLTEKFRNDNGTGISKEDLVGGNGLPTDYCSDILTKCADYEDAEEQGLLIKLLCSNWLDIVFGEQEVFWGIDTDYNENPIREITIDNSERFTWHDGWKTVVLKGIDENGFDWEFSPEEIGKTVFLTQKQAEKALKKKTQMKKYGVVLKEKCGAEGLTREEMSELLDILEGEQMFPLDLEAREHECAAEGFINPYCAGILDYDYESSGFHDFIAGILDDMDNESENNEYEYWYNGCKIPIYLGR